MVSPSSVAATRLCVIKTPQGTQEPSPAVPSASLPWDVTPPSQRTDSELPCSSFSEHANYFGVDEKLGPVAVSIKREKLEDHKDHGPQYQYRIIFRTREVGLVTHVTMTYVTATHIAEPLSVPGSVSKRFPCSNFFNPSHSLTRAIPLVSPFYRQED